MQLRSQLFVTCLHCALLLRIIEARQYVLVRRIYAGEEGQAMLEQDESSRMLGWPLGVSSETAFMDSAPILSAVVEKDEDSNEVLSSKSEVSRSTGLYQGRAASRRVEGSPSEKNGDIAFGSVGLVEAKGVERGEIDAKNLEADTVESQKGTNSTGPGSDGNKPRTKVVPGSRKEPRADEDKDSIDLEDIERIMSRTSEISGV